MMDHSRLMIKELFAGPKKLWKPAGFLRMRDDGGGVFRTQSGLNLLPRLLGHEHGSGQQDHQNDDGRGEKPTGIAGLHGKCLVKIIEYQPHMSPYCRTDFNSVLLIGKSMRRESRQSNLFAIVLDDFDDSEYTHNHQIFQPLN
jgi:hypothetical protein